MNVTYSFMECPGQTCRGGDLELEMITHEGARVTTRDAIIPDDHGQNASKVSSRTKQFYFDFKTPVENGYHLVLKSVRACATVFQVMVYHYQCPRESVVCGKTAEAPSSGAVVVRSNCVKGFDFASIAVTDVLMCTLQGKWLTCKYTEDKEVTCKGKLITVIFVLYWCCVSSLN